MMSMKKAWETVNRKNTWLTRELKFISWLYNYKNFLGKLKEKDFKSFFTREEAIKKWEKEIGE